jgi:transposase
MVKNPRLRTIIVLLSNRDHRRGSFYRERSYIDWTIISSWAEVLVMSGRLASNAGQLMLVPSDMGFWLPEDHQARFFNDFIENECDLTSICEKFKKQEKRGRPAYDQVMLTKLILYGYSVGLTSSREIEGACLERIDFRYLSGNRQPDHRTISTFRQKHLTELAALFKQVLSIAIDEELVEMKDVAFDGTKVLANASKRKAMSYEHMCAKTKVFRREIADLKNERLNARKQKRKKKRQQLDAEIKFKKDRLKKIRKAKKGLERHIRQEHDRKPYPKEQRNFTDPESRIMKVGGDFEQCYNAQAAVDKKHQIILAASVCQQTNDKKLLEPTIEDVFENVGLIPDRGLADAGYFSEQVLQSVATGFSTTEWFIATGRLPHGRSTKAPRGRIPKNISATDRMKRLLCTKRGKSIYAQRKAVVEPVFGQIKEANLQFRQFSFRGLASVQHEWQLVCAVHNLLKIHRNRKRTVQTKQALAA